MKAIRRVISERLSQGQKLSAVVSGLGLTATEKRVLHAYVLVRSPRSKKTVLQDLGIASSTLSLATSSIKLKLRGIEPHSQQLNRFLAMGKLKLAKFILRTASTRTELLRKSPWASRAARMLGLLDYLLPNQKRGPRPDSPKPAREEVRANRLLGELYRLIPEVDVKRLRKIQARCRSPMRELLRLCRRTHRQGRIRAADVRNHLHLETVQINQAGDRLRALLRAALPAALQRTKVDRYAAMTDTQLIKAIRATRVRTKTKLFARDRSLHMVAHERGILNYLFPLRPVASIRAVWRSCPASSRPDVLEQLPRTERLILNQMVLPVRALCRTDFGRSHGMRVSAVKKGERSLERHLRSLKAAAQAA